MSYPDLTVIDRDFRIEVDIAAAPETVWAVMSDVERWHEWTVSVRRVRVLGNGRLAMGSRVFVKQPRLLPALWKVTAIEPGRRFVWETAAPGMHVSAIHEVEPTASGAHATLQVKYDGAIGRWLADRIRDLTCQYLEYEAAGLKKRSESAATA
jgi:uncharacterized protein YndB with AHSA1/START domain